MSIGALLTIAIASLILNSGLMILICFLVRFHSQMWASARAKFDREVAARRRAEDIVLRLGASHDALVRDLQERRVSSPTLGAVPGVSPPVSPGTDFHRAEDGQ